MSVCACNRLARVLVACAAAALTAPALLAAPSVRSAMMRFGGSPRLPTGEWVYLTYELQNPDAEAVTVRLSLRAAERGRSVYEKTVTVAPKATLRAREPVTADDASEYVLSVFLGDERIQRETVVVSNTDTIGSTTLMVLNDDPDFSLPGEFLVPGLLREPVAFAAVAAREAPTHWAAYGHVRAVVIGRPQYRDLSAVQFAALEAYAEHGGAVLFVSPEGTLAAAATPWSALLPVVPLRVRQVEALPELDACGEECGDTLPWRAGQPPRQPLADRDGFPVLESAPCGDGITTLRSSIGPLVRWRRHGLGRTAVVATDACHPRIVHSGVFVPLWNHVLCTTQPVFALRNFENSQSLPTVLSHLTGFTIPGANAVGGVLFGYVACLLAVLVGGLVWRRHVASWLVAAALGVLLTAVIFGWAFHQNASRAASRAAVLDLCLSGERRGGGHCIVSLFATKDLRPAVRARASTCRLRSLPSPARGKRREPLDAPLIVQREGDLAGLHGIAVQALKPREFAAEYETAPETLAPLRLVLGPRGAAFASEAMAEDQLPSAARWYLLTGDELMPIRRESLRGGELGSGARLLEGDPFLTDLRRYLTQGSFPRPALIALQRWEDARGRDLPVEAPDFAQDGYALRWFPVAMEAAPGAVHVPAELLRVESVRSGSRLLAYLGAAQEGTILRGARTVLVYEVSLPPILAELRPEQVSVDLDLANAGGNIDVGVRLLRSPLWLGAPATELDALGVWDKGVSPTTTAGSISRFSGAAVASLIRSQYCRFRLLVQLSQKQFVTTAQDAERANRWRLNRLNVTVDGALPPTDETRKL